MASAVALVWVTILVSTPSSKAASTFAATAMAASANFVASSAIEIMLARKWLIPT